MAKFHGVVGYAELVEAEKSVWVEQIVTKNATGDIIKNVTRVQAGSAINDNITISNVISIVADSYAIEHMFALRYVTWMGVKWKATSVDVQLPRLLITLGGVYNG